MEIWTKIDISVCKGLEELPWEDTFECPHPLWLSVRCKPSVNICLMENRVIQDAIEETL